MKQYFILFISLFLCLQAHSEGFSIKEGNGIPYNTANDIFIFYGNMDNVRMEFTIEDSAGFEWKKYDKDFQIIPLVENTDYEIAEDGKSTILNNVEADYGYIVVYENDEWGAPGPYEKSMWITTYLPINSVKWNEDQIICSNMYLNIQPPMYYYPLQNRIKTLIKRELDITYTTFESRDHQPDIYEVTQNSLFADTLLLLDTVPYVHTDFLITDNLGKRLSADSDILTDTFYTVAVVSFPSMTVINKQENELDPDNSWEKDEFDNVIVYLSEEQNDESITQFRTSAPLSIDFKSYASPEVDRYEWYFSREKNFFGAFVYFEKDINNFVFNEPGYHYIKLVVSSVDATGTLCSHTTYATINISESEIHVPNAFTPNGDGINDEFKVAYKSIESYRCRIYNQWGRKVYDSTDITQGWDGKIGGSNASIGVYYYVIEAKGTDGQEITKKGDINLLRSR